MPRSLLKLKYAKFEFVAKSITDNPWIKDFNHLLPVHRYPGKQEAPFRNTVRPADRIKLWNIVPGDQFRAVWRDGCTEVFDVGAISRFRNRVWARPKVSKAECLLLNL